MEIRTTLWFFAGYEWTRQRYPFQGIVAHETCESRFAQGRVCMLWRFFPCFVGYSLGDLAKSRLPIAMVLTRNWNPWQLQLSMLLPDRLSDVHECDWDGFLKTLFNTKPWPYAVAFQNVLQFTTIHNSWMDGSHHCGPNLGSHIQGLRSESKFTGQICNWTLPYLERLVSYGIVWS